MKVSLLLLVPSFFCSEMAFSQPTLDQVYGEIGFIGGSHASFKAAINTVFNDDHFITACYGYSVRKARGVPQDYSTGGTTSVDFPKQYVLAYGLMYGRVFYTRTIFRFTVKGGAAYLNVNTPVNFQPIRAGLPGSNYNYTVKDEFTAGLLFNPTTEMQFGSGFGLSIGLNININPISPVYGLECSLLIGRLGENFPLRLINL